MPIIAPEVCRFAVNGTLAGQDIVNIIDVNITATEGRDEALFDTAGAIIDAWVDNVLQALHNTYSFDSVSWVDLNSEGGLTGSRTQTPTNVLPETGTNSGGVLPNNAVAVVVKNLSGKTRQQRNGSIRLAGIPEDFTIPGSGNFLTNDAVTGYSTALNGFATDVSTASGGLYQLVVIHTVEGAYDGKSEILSFQTKSQIGTQRRRMPGYGT